MERSSKLEDRRSPRTVLQEAHCSLLIFLLPKLLSFQINLIKKVPFEQKKKGLRMVDLETKLDQTMEELKQLKCQLASEAAAKTVVCPQSTTSVQNPEGVYEEDEKDKPLSIEKDCDSCITSDVDEIAASCTEENASKMEMSMLRAKLAEKVKELETVAAEKERLKQEVEEAMASSSIAGKKAEELEIKLLGTEEALKQSKSLVEQLKLSLEAEELAKASMESEMKCLRIQTDQWRKASEAAASILATGDSNLRSTQRPLESYNFPANGVLWSPLITGAEVDEGLEAQKKRGGGGGIRVFGELWKKKGQQK